METIITFILGVGSALLLGLISYGVVVMVRIIKESKKSTEMISDIYESFEELKFNQQEELSELTMLLQDKEKIIQQQVDDIDRKIDSRLDKLEFKIKEDIEMGYNDLIKNIEKLKKDFETLEKSK